MKLIVENKIPHIAPLLAELPVEPLFLSPGAITRDAISDAEGLIVRTRTRCDAALLDGTAVRFIATATIGTDHIDLDYCRRRGITVASAPGCNAPAVAQWVFAALAAVRPDAQTLGIVGCGHVGSIVERWGRAMGLRVLVNDPPRAMREGPGGFCDLATIAREADVITFHTPLDATTRHLASREFFAALRRRPAIFNAARGAIVDTPALVEALDKGLAGAAAIDCWENEPNISAALLERAAVATPHIAGYSRQGKMRASIMAADALRRYLGMAPTGAAESVHSVPEAVSLAEAAASYDIVADTVLLRARTAEFEALRNGYSLREEL
mgnify:FL=1|jgi:erythronate-4-phosphate dehydrogenase